MTGPPGTFTCCPRSTGTPRGEIAMATAFANQALRRRLSRLVSAFALAAPALVAQQQSPTSRTIFFNGIQTTLPPSGTQDLTVQLWDDPTAGNLLFTEVPHDTFTF